MNARFYDANTSRFLSQDTYTGNACYHISSWEPEAADLGEKFFRGINLRGLGNIEFKRDLRDGKLKVIECNARFTAAQELLNRSGMDISEIIYLKSIVYELNEVVVENSKKTKEINTFSTY